MEMGRAMIRLPRGLHVELQCMWLEWRLDLWRDNTYPSRHEIDTLRGAFAVPDDAQEYRDADRIVIKWSEEEREEPLQITPLPLPVVTGRQLSLL